MINGSGHHHSSETMTTLDELDTRIEGRVNSLVAKGIWAFTGFLIANAIVFAGVIWWASRLDERVARNTDTIQVVVGFSERQVRTEETLKAISDRTMRIERQIEALWGMPRQ